MKSRIPLLALALGVALPAATPVTTAGDATAACMPAPAPEPTPGAAKNPKPPSDLTGDWVGVFKDGHDTGTLFFTFNQTGATGTFTGQALINGGGMVNVTGTYVMNGRKIESGDAMVDDGSGIDQETLTGKTTSGLSELKLTFKDSSGKVKLTLTPD